MHTLDGIDFKNLGNDVTVKTSVSYKVSSSKGKKISYRLNPNLLKDSQVTLKIMILFRSKETCNE